GCAGSTDAWIHIERPRSAVEEGAAALAVTISGGLGGHSGSNIALGRSNAIKLLGRTLRQAAEVPLRLVSLDGGRSRNAIPRDATAVISVPKAGVAEFRRAVDAVASEIRDEFGRTDPRVEVTVHEVPPAEDAWSVAD